MPVPQNTLIWSKHFELANRRVDPQGNSLYKPMVEAHRSVAFGDTGVIGIRSWEMISPGTLRVYEAEVATVGSDPFQKKQTPAGVDIELFRGSQDLRPDSGNFVNAEINRPPLGFAGDSLIQFHPDGADKIYIIEYDGMGKALDAGTIASFDDNGPGHIIWHDFSIIPAHIRSNLMDQWIAIKRSRGYVLWDGTSPESQGVANPLGLTVADLSGVMNQELHLRPRPLAEMGTEREDSVLEHDHSNNLSISELPIAELAKRFEFLQGVANIPAGHGNFDSVNFQFTDEETNFNPAPGGPSPGQYRYGAASGSPGDDTHTPLMRARGSQGPTFPVPHSLDVLGVSSARTNTEENRVRERAVVVMVKVW